MIYRSQQEIIDFSKSKISEVTDLTISEIDEKIEFTSLGLDSIKSLLVMQELEEYMDMDINPLLFWNYPTLELLSKHLSKQKKSDTKF